MTFRVISRLDIKPPNLVKGVHLEGLRKIGDPRDFAVRYYKQGADEISYQDIVASLYNRNSIQELVSSTAEEVFVPITVGGGIRTVADAALLIRSGADKVCINTAAIQKPEILEDLSSVFGAQAIVLGIEAKRVSNGKYLVMTDSGREHSGIDVTEWVDITSRLGVGEFLITSIDREGTKSGFDFELFELVKKLTTKPIVMHGGAGGLQDILEIAKMGADGVAIASVLHFEILTISQIKEFLHTAGVEVRI
jgi:cyclase